MWEHSSAVGKGQGRGAGRWRWFMGPRIPAPASSLAQDLGEVERLQDVRAAEGAAGELQPWQVFELTPPHSPSQRGADPVCPE